MDATSPLPAAPRPAARDAPGAGVPTVGALFAGFFTLGLTGFGGVLPLARRMLVERRRWLSAAEFTELLGLCQFLPGGNIINLSVAIGLRFRGARGALACILGLIAAPTAVVIGLGVLYDRFSDEPHVRHLFAGLAASAAGLLVSMAIKVSWPLRRDGLALAVGGVCVAAIAIARLPLLPTLLVLLPLGVLVRWRRVP